jgi:hypothetical protein
VIVLTEICAELDFNVTREDEGIIAKVLREMIAKKWLMILAYIF